MSTADSTAVVWPWPGWRGYPCADASHSGLILKRCADCGKRKAGVSTPLVDCPISEGSAA